MTDTEGLFQLPEAPAATPWQPGRVETGLLAAIEAGRRAGTLVAEDLGLVGAALVGARGLDAAERGKPGQWRPEPYAIAALLTPYREALAALRLPAAVEPAEQPRPSAGTPADAASLLGDIFGTAHPAG